MLAVSPAWDVGCGLWCACALGTVQIMHNPGTIRDAQVAWPSGAVGYSYRLCGHILPSKSLLVSEGYDFLTTWTSLVLLGRGTRGVGK